MISSFKGTRQTKNYDGPKRESSRASAESVDITSSISVSSFFLPLFLFRVKALNFPFSSLEVFSIGPSLYHIDKLCVQCPIFDFGVKIVTNRGAFESFLLLPNSHGTSHKSFPLDLPSEQVLRPIWTFLLSLEKPFFFLLTKILFKFIDDKITLRHLPCRFSKKPQNLWGY